tara:strand:+ start:39 stop:230 length:192 start_codon:yes stop_codon:yes gene_type:complete
MRFKIEKSLYFKIIGYVIIGFIVLINIRFILKLPPILKLMALGADIISIYLVYNYFINNKSKK